MSDVVYRSEVRIERVCESNVSRNGPQSVSPGGIGVGHFSASTPRLRSITRFHPLSWSPAQRRSTTLSPQRPAELREPLEAYWKRVKSTSVITQIRPIVIT